MGLAHFLLSGFLKVFDTLIGVDGGRIGWDALQSPPWSYTLMDEHV
jgi:hypothetical protein